MLSHVVVAVLGDVGRSPRMQYHANSFSKCKGVGKVTLLGYEGEQCMPIVSDNECITQRRFKLREFSGVKKLSSVLFAGTVVYQL